MNAPTVIRFRDRRGRPGQFEIAGPAYMFDFRLSFDTVAKILLTHGSAFPFDIMYESDTDDFDGYPSVQPSWDSVDLEMADYLTVDDMIATLRTYGKFELYTLPHEVEKYVDKECRHVFEHR